MSLPITAGTVENADISPQTSAQETLAYHKLSTNLGATAGTSLGKLGDKITSLFTAVLMTRGRSMRKLQFVA